MDNISKIKIDLLNFFKHGTFDTIKLGQSKELILNNFPYPDGHSKANINTQENILLYGNIEFHFDKSNNLSMIFTDHLDDIYGGENIDINLWIFEDYSKLNLVYILSHFNIEEIDYCKSSSQLGITISSNVGIELFFSKPEDKLISQNDWLPSSLVFKN